MSERVITQKNPHPIGNYNVKLISYLFEVFYEINNPHPIENYLLKLISYEFEVFYEISLSHILAYNFQLGWDCFVLDAPKWIP